MSYRRYSQAEIARANALWSRKKPSASRRVPTMNREQLAAAARELIGRSYAGKHTYFLVVGKPGSLWYFLRDLRDREFERLSPWSVPAGILKGENPWKMVKGQLAEFRDPYKYNVIYIDPYTGKVTPPVSYADMELTGMRAAANPYARQNVAAATVLTVISLLTPIVRKYGGAKWAALKAMPIDQRAVALRDLARNVQWVNPGLALGTRSFRKLAPFKAKRAAMSQKFWVGLASAMDTPEVQEAMERAGSVAADVGGAAISAKMGRARLKKIAANNPDGPGWWHSWREDGGNGNHVEWIPASIRGAEAKSRDYLERLGVDRRRCVRTQAGLHGWPSTQGYHWKGKDGTHHALTYWSASRPHMAY